MGNAWDRGADSLTGTRTLQSGEVFGDSRQEATDRRHVLQQKRPTQGAYIGAFLLGGAPRYSAGGRYAPVRVRLAIR